MIQAIETPIEAPPELSNKDMYALMYLLLAKVGTIEIPQTVFDSAPGPEVLQIARQWDSVQKVWRFFVQRKPRDKKPKLFIPKKPGIITSSQ